MSNKKSAEPHVRLKNTEHKPERFKVGHAPDEYRNAGPLKKLLWRIVDGLSAGL
ncbi:MAG: hypothetical protein ABJN52_10905 [Litorimonas sp.]